MDDVAQERPGCMKIKAKSRTTGIAMKAAQEAKQANDDMVNAVKVASDRIKLEYADKASTAAKAAEAVLASKQQVLEQLEMEVREAEIIVQEELLELSSAEANSQLALKAHQQAQEETKLLISGLKLAKENCASAEQVSTACQQSMAVKASLLEAAQKRVGVLLRQLSEARNDYAKTKKAAYRAMCAANEAKQRINHTKR
ncbi:GH19706 [Drosophila grimshawi]|uniref:GH19706 n=2 Tax=Drosophila grimshawi TaxID=7222 RepID=B4K035_DROGR|nr:GH19706 [Drosophila grimshawi]